MDASTAIPKTESATPDGEDGDPADTARALALVARLDASGYRSTAELLRELRQAFPDAPLSVRIKALRALGRS